MSATRFRPVRIIAAGCLAGVLAACSTGGEHEAGHEGDDPVVSSSSAGGHEMPGHGESPGAADRGDGLAASRGGYTLAPVSVPSAAGRPSTLAFRILGPDGKPHTSYVVEQTKLLHFYLVRSDMVGYQHLHPDLVGDTWRTPVTVSATGVYRIYADFVAKAADGTTQPRTLGTQFTITGPALVRAPLPPPAATAVADGYTVTRVDGTATLAAGRPTTMKLRFTNPAGQPATDLETILDAYAHVSAFEVANLALSHLHPDQQASGNQRGGPELTFQTTFPRPGNYRLFLQFSTGGKVHLAAFTVNVA